MEKKLLVINVGTASKKYAFYLGAQKILSSHFEKENGEFIVTHKDKDGKENKLVITEADFQNSSAKEVDYLVESGLVKDKKEISAVGFRIVCPGDFFNQTRKIDTEYRQKMRADVVKAPLHISSIADEVDKFANAFPELPMFGVSDSTFHLTLSKEAESYAIANDVAKELGIQRYGYHGISMQSALLRLKSLLGEIPQNIAICHLGSGSSITAIKDGKSFDTSMGFTPLEGLVMSTRVGDIDAGALIYLMKAKNFSPDQLSEFLNKQCGLGGVSGKSNDVRELIALEEGGDEQAKIALDLLAYRVKKYIGSYTFALGGLDVLVFAGTIGERSWIIRQRILRGLENLGLEVDDAKNKKITEINGEGEIQKDGSRIKIVVVKIDEMAEIALEVGKIL
ncbi:MAG TPA: acetate/propionate family kinase [Candidatus Paceibacterota bacterium]|nr:acetate/propionate family kinase [Candidatus Paceibacterota bacterium]HPT40256.1 acetate/propionate family kinase [Candidatus Paceibacterota bacterium]